MDSERGDQPMAPPCGESTECRSIHRAGLATGGPVDRAASVVSAAMDEAPPTAHRSNPSVASRVDDAETTACRMPLDFQKITCEMTSSGRGARLVRHLDANNRWLDLPTNLG